MSTKQTTTAVPAVDRAIELLQAIAAAPKPLLLSELSELTATSRSTAFNILATLQKHGFVEKDERFKTYRLGLKLFELGSAYLTQMNLTPAFNQVARRLVDICRETVKLGMLDGRDVVYVGAVEAPHSVRLVTLVGARMPAHTTAIGKILLAQLNDAELTALYADYLFARPTPHTIDNLAQLQATLATVREAGHAYDCEESSLGVNCVAAPVRNHTGAVIAAMSIGIPNHRRNPNTMDELTLLIKSYAYELSRALGWLDV